jgi:hypothetical protein
MEIVAAKRERREEIAKGISHQLIAPAQCDCADHNHWAKKSLRAGLSCDLILVQVENGYL